MFSDKKKNDRWAFIGGEYSRIMTSSEKDDSASKWHKKKLKFGNSDEKTTDSLKNISSTTLVIRFSLDMSHKKPVRFSQIC